MGQDISFAGVRGGGDCFCFEESPDEEKLIYVGEEQCREPCQGDPTFFCGGTTALHIYAASERVRGNHMYSNFSYPDQLVQLGGFGLVIAVTRRQLRQVQLRRLKTSVWSRKLIFLCQNLLKSGIGSMTFSSENFSNFPKLFGDVLWSHFR